MVAAGKPYILFVGALHPRNNIEGLLIGFEEYKSRTTGEVKLLGVGGKICIDKGSRAQRIASDVRGGHLHTVGHGIAVAEGEGQVPGDAAGIINSLVSRVVDEAGKLVAVHDGVGHPECLDAVIEIPEIAVGMDINSVLGCGGDLAAAG
jgi:hypothetical protein